MDSPVPPGPLRKGRLTYGPDYVSWASVSSTNESKHTLRIPVHVPRHIGTYCFNRVQSLQELLQVGMMAVFMGSLRSAVEALYKRWPVTSYLSQFT